MHHPQRREFIKQSAIIAAALTMPGCALALGKKQPLLSFSTLGCPKWSLSEIINFASSNGYQGIEIRTIEGEMELPRVPAFSSARIKDTKKLLQDKRLVITDLGSSTTLHYADKQTRQKHLDEGRRFIDLAEKLDCRYVRVFPDKIPPEQGRELTLDLITEGLNELGSHAKGSRVKILLESHGDVVKTEDLLYIMERTGQYGAGLIWDILNMWDITREPAGHVYNSLKKYIRHIHVKDASYSDGKLRYVLVGKGEAPVKEAIQLLHRNNFDGFYSFEWEKMWHPEIEEPELALAHFPGAMKTYFNSSTL